MVATLQFTITNSQLPMNDQFSIFNEAQNGKCQMGNEWKMENGKWSMTSEGGVR